MFTFLHDLGSAIGREPSDGELSKTIVEGVMDVVGAEAGTVYYVSADPGMLSPAYLSEVCPALIEVPEEVSERAKEDERALESHLRLARVAVGEGVIGGSFAAAEAVHLRDVRTATRGADGEEIMLSAMVSPLRYAGNDIGVLAVTKSGLGKKFSKNDFAVFRSVAEQSSFAIGNARVHREASRKRAIEGELKNAREVQRVLLPQEDPLISGFRVNGINLPARIISGDYYDYLGLPQGKLGVVIADVSGKGVAAGLLMAMCRSLLRAVSLTDASPSKVLGAVNGYLFDDIREDMFISMIYAVLDPERGEIVLARAGHEPALVYRRASGLVEVFRPKGMALGLDNGRVFERVIKDQVIALDSGDCMLLFTDGVKEALSENHEEFGMERLATAFEDTGALGAEAVVSEVQEVLHRFTGEGPQMDDITIVAIEKR